MRLRGLICGALGLSVAGSSLSRSPVERLTTRTGGRLCCSWPIPCRWLPERPTPLPRVGSLARQRHALAGAAPADPGMKPSGRMRAERRWARLPRSVAAHRTWPVSRWVLPALDLRQAAHFHRSDLSALPAELVRGFDTHIALKAPEGSGQPVQDSVLGLMESIDRFEEARPAGTHGRKLRSARVRSGRS